MFSAERFHIMKPLSKKIAIHRIKSMAKEKSWGQRIFFPLNLLLWLALVVVLAISFTPLTSYMMEPLTVKEDLRQADVIVVLAGGVDNGRYLTLASSHRMVRGAQLYFAGKAKKILLSGGDPGKVGVAEALVMAQEIKKLNIPAEDIVVEKRSTRTHEQAVEIKKIAGPLRWKSLILVTSASHMKRSLMAFENAGFKVYPASADPYEKYVDGPLDRLRLFQRLAHEYIGIVYYKIRGWI